MTLKEASEIYYIKIEIGQVEREIEELESKRQFYMSNVVSDMPKAKGRRKDLAADYMARHEALYNLLGCYMMRLQQKTEEFETFLSSVDDKEMQVILRYRCIFNLSWSEIGDACGMDRRTASRKYYAFFKSEMKLAHNAHT